jgi:tripartite-type tricarboxylate transporter receptor subunit TctC
MDDEDAAAWSPVAAGRLRHLVATVHPRSRGPYTDQEIADGSNTKAGAVLVTAEQVAALREGRTASAQSRQIDAVAAFIGVAPQYFQDDELAARVDEQLEQLSALVELRARGVVSFRACSRDGYEPSPKAILAMIEHAREATEL